MTHANLTSYTLPAIKRSLGVIKIAESDNSSKDESQIPENLAHQQHR